MSHIDELALKNIVKQFESHVYEKSSDELKDMMEKIVNAIKLDQVKAIDFDEKLKKFMFIYNDV